MAADGDATALTAMTAAGSAAMGAFSLWLANRLLGKAAFQTAINNGFQALTNELQEERKALLKQLNEVQIQAAGERAELRGEIINLTQVVEGLKSILRRHGIPVPKSKALLGGEMITLAQEDGDAEGG